MNGEIQNNSTKKAMVLENIKGILKKKHTWILIGTILSIFIAKSLFFSSGSGLTHKEFEDELKSMSDGKISIVDSEVIPDKDGESIYKAKWNGINIVIKIDKHEKMVLPYIVMSQPKYMLNEISIGQYQELITNLSRLADPKFSDSDSEHLITNDLNFNVVVMSGQEHSTSKHGISYSLAELDSNNTYSFIVQPEKKE
ncbi:hypothetical protein [Bacillus cereus]|uniref:hypothetical protein n=1 Tax=Bacillus cereus TaxID=1396 RepID=UPI00187A6D9D|nr:hypothetical protein [Bacillus cereus]MBE7122938.1 hypothetical protein [Bacillus cereus]